MGVVERTVSGGHNDLKINPAFLIVFGCCLAVTAQTPKNFTKDNLSFDYPEGWTLSDDSNSDAQQYTLSKDNSDVQIRLFVHKGRIAPEKLPDAKKAFIDPYVAATAKQFVQMGANRSRWPTLPRSAASRLTA